MFWSCFLHFYQPPTQKRYWIDRITNESYRRLIEGFLNHPEARITLNINALLFEFWDKYGHRDVLDSIQKLLMRNQIELTGTAKYHPLLPRLPEAEIVRQIKLNDETSKKYLGELYKPRGFFPPEMAYERKVAKVVASLGYEWIIAEELSLNHGFGAVDYSKIYEVEGIKVKSQKPWDRSSDSRITDNRLQNLMIFFRERSTSYKILSGQLGTPKLFLDALSDRVSKNEYLLTGMDGETFGHHRPGMDKLLMELFEVPAVKPLFISDLPKFFEGREVVKTLPSTWALMSHDLEKNVPFARWEDPENKIHKMQWELTNLAIAAVGDSKFKIQNSKFEEEDLSRGQLQWLKARNLLDRAIHSDQYWWASARPWWSLEMIERGAKELLEVVEILSDIPEEKKNEARSTYYDIVTTGFDWQREGKVEALARAEDEAVRMRVDEGIPELPSEEIDKMVATIKEEMLEVARNQEYERAAQLRDRIKELESYKNK